MEKSDEELINEWRKDRVEFKEEQLVFWEEEYPVLSLNERKQIWYRNIWRDIFMQMNTVGKNEFYMFTRENYTVWKKYSDIEEILDFVIKKLDEAYDRDGSLIRELNQKLGRE